MANAICLLLFIITGIFGNIRAIQIPCGRQQVRGNRILGGEDTYNGEFPWMVSIQRNGDHICGGAIIHSQWILTAAHCLLNYRNELLVVQIGQNELGQSSKNVIPFSATAKEIIIHPNFSDPFYYSNDIALLKLSRNILFSHYSWPICLPDQQASYIGSEGTVIGWGSTTDSSIGKWKSRLQKARVPVITNHQCQIWYAKKGIYFNLSYQQLCAGYHDGRSDSCKGDSGSPLQVKVGDNYVIIGIVSAGIGCGKASMPGVYTRVSSFLPWILQHINT